MDERQTMQRLRAGRVARLATSGPGGPHLVPVVYAVDGQTIVTAVDRKPKTTGALQRLRNVEADPRVALVVDHYEEDWGRLWWVRADGTARVVRSGSELTDAIALLADKYPQYRSEPPPGPAVVIEIRRVSSWAAQPG